MIVDLISYRVQSGKESEFEAQQQEWQQVMRGARGFIGQILMRSLDDPAQYHAEVRWASREYHERFGSGENAEGRRLAQKLTSVLESPPAHRLLEYV